MNHDLNHTESLKNVNMITRRLPLISLLEFMGVIVQRWIHKHNEKAAKTRFELIKKYDLKLQKSIALSRSMRTCFFIYSIIIKCILVSNF